MLERKPCREGEKPTKREKLPMGLDYDSHGSDENGQGQPREGQGALQQAQGREGGRRSFGRLRDAQKCRLPLVSQGKHDLPVPDAKQKRRAEARFCLFSCMVA